MKNSNGPIEILIAEDSPTQAEQLRFLLEENGYKVYSARNGMEALALLGKHQPSLVISDVVMPELDGYGLCKAIKSDDRLKHIPVMLVTTLSDSDDVIHGLECGADNFVRKPYDEKYLLSRIDYLLMNIELRKNQRMQMALEIHLGGRKHVITAERQQILDLLVSTYEQAVRVNNELKEREDQLAHSNQVLKGLNRIAEGLNAVTSEHEVVEMALQRALELPGIQAGWIFLRTPENGFRLAGSCCLPPALANPEDFSGDCACQRKLLGGEFGAASNIVECERLAKAKGDTHGLACHASVPLWLGRGNPLGLMNLAGLGKGMFNEEELEVLYSVGNQVAVALERARLHENLGMLVVERTAELVAEIEERKRIEQEQARVAAELESANAALSDERTHLSERVEERTAELTTTNAELAEAKSAAEQASRAKSAFLATMSHEIRTPMNGVIGMVDVLAQSNLSEHQTDLVNTIRESANSLLGIIDDILDFSKIEAGKLDLEHAPVAVADLVEGLCNSLVPVANHKGVDLNLFISPEIPEQVLSDDVRLRQVLYNLAGNAIKFSAGRPEQRGHVSVRVEIASHEPLQLAFRISDNGIGMVPETVSNLFTPFTQAEVSTTRRFGGSGLGLTICKRLVDLLQGTLSVESTLGKGSTFTVTLSFDVPAEQPGRTLPDLAGLDCIIVDGTGFNAADLRIYLEHAGAHVRLEKDPAAAARSAAEFTKPSVVILDAGRGTDTLKSHELFASLPNVRQLLITRGRRRCARVEGAHTVTLDGNALRHLALLRAVAVAVGRASPEIFHGRSAQPLQGEKQPPTIAEARALGKLILVAEDDEINQKVILKQLDLLGYAAEVAGNGLEALQLWREGQYALLITDLHMPEMDGYSLATNIRNEEAGRSRIPILALTANALRGEASRAREVGMDEYMVKPVQIQTLSTILEKWLPQAAGASAPPARKQENDEQQTPSVAISVLENLVGNDPAVVAEFLADYLASARQLAEEIHAAMTDEDPHEAGAIAHKLKSSSRAVGALALGDLCAEIENSGKAGNSDSLAELLTQFDAALAGVETDITAILAKPQPSS